MLQKLDDNLRKLYMEKIQIANEIQRRAKRNKIYELYPEDGPLSRHNYPKHMEFFKAGDIYRERCFMAANRIGKSFGAGGYETALHLTGLYPDWWEGAVFDEPVNAWAAGKTNQTTRDIIQLILFGEVLGSKTNKRLSGTGLIIGDRIGEYSWQRGVSDLLDTVEIQHVSGGMSTIALKSYEQGRGAFEGTAKEVIWLDEEPPLEIYTECLIRTATTDGIVYMTFTPLEGMSPTVLQFLPNGLDIKND